jgi:hypothetical protein
MSNGPSVKHPEYVTNSTNSKWGSSGLVIRLAVLVLVLIPVTLLAGQSDKKMKRSEPRKLVYSVTSTYNIFQVDKQIGSETVTRNDYSDNTVDFESTITLQLPNGAGVSTKGVLLLEDESYFPMGYNSVRTMMQSGTEFDNGTYIEWFANVALVRRKTPASEDTTHVVLPTGTAVLDVNAAHHLYQLLKWYDFETGGVQGFNVLDPTLARLYSASLRLLAEETITIDGNEFVASRFDFNRNKNTAKVYVDAEKRILKVDQGYMVYELADWSESPVQEK